MLVLPVLYFNLVLTGLVGLSTYGEGAEHRIFTWTLIGDEAADPERTCFGKGTTNSSLYRIMRASHQWLENAKCCMTSNSILRRTTGTYGSRDMA